MVRRGLVAGVPVLSAFAAFVALAGCASPAPTAVTTPDDAGIGSGSSSGGHSSSGSSSGVSSSSSGSSGGTASSSSGSSGGSSDGGDAGAPEGEGGAGNLAFGAACTTASQCSTDDCQLFAGMGGDYCTKPCTVDSDCPNPPNLGCNGMGYCKVP